MSERIYVSDSQNDKVVSCEHRFGRRYEGVKGIRFLCDPISPSFFRGKWFFLILFASGNSVFHTRYYFGRRLVRASSL